MLNIISLGAGVQSSTMALMAAHGEITPMPDAAIFADTGAEPEGVYTWLDWLEPQLPFPVHRVMWKEGLLKNIQDSVGTGSRWAAAPFYTTSPKGDGMGILRRQCTREFKIQPIERKVRELCGLAKGQRAPRGELLATQWIGISLDEIQRMKDSEHAWCRHRWPLIEMRMTRGHCLEWMQANGYPAPPRSACTFCPYHSNHEWRNLRDNDPAGWAQAVSVDALIRNGGKGTTETLYVHRDGVPLDQVDLSDPHEGQGQMFSMMDECDGMCGV